MVIVIVIRWGVVLVAAAMVVVIVIVIVIVSVKVDQCLRKNAPWHTRSKQDHIYTFLLAVSHSGSSESADHIAFSPYGETQPKT